MTEATPVRAKGKAAISSAAIIKIIALLMVVGAIFRQMTTAGAVTSGSVSSAMQATQIYSESMVSLLVNVCILLALLVWAVVSLTDTIRAQHPPS